MRQNAATIEIAAFIYLAAPLAVFFLTFINPLIGWPAAAFIAYCSFDLVASRSREKSQINVGVWLYISAVCIVWMILGGYGRVFPENSDWIKDYAIMNELGSAAWPPIAHGEMLRYSLGWYLIPSIVERVTWLSANTTLSVWSLIGLMIFMRMLVDLLPRQSYIVLAPIVFVLFSGMDIVGTLITNLRIGPPHHISWWIGWIAYPSTTTSLFWMPQHAIPAWLGIALVMRKVLSLPMQRNLPVVFVAICFWSPFAAASLAIFVPVLMRYHGRQWLISKRSLISLFIGAPVIFYLTSGSNAIPGWFMIFSAHGVPFMQFAKSYALFIGVELSLVIAILIFSNTGDKTLLGLSAALLLALPVLHVGQFNDLAMKASIAPLAVLAILCAEALASGRLWTRGALSVALAIGAFTPAFEVWRALESTSFCSEQATFGDGSVVDAQTRVQYFSNLTPFLVR